jgi:hypothetical protein
LIDQHGGLAKIARSREAVVTATNLLLEFAGDVASIQTPEDDAANLRSAENALRTVRAANDLPAE